MQLSREDILKVFCPTGEGGGIDPTCSPHDGGDDINSPEFKKWFAGSKVVDSDGKPLVVYHGTGRDFETFRTPAFFTTDKDAAASYQGAKSPEPKDAHTISAYLSLKNPATVEDFVRLGFDEDQIIQRDAHKLIETLKRKGFDGAQFFDQRHDTGDVIEAWVAFYPENIRKLRSVNSRENILKAFCPTGEGGGIDNSCSPTGESGKYVEVPHYESAVKDVLARVDNWSKDARDIARAAAMEHVNSTHGTTLTRLDDANGQTKGVMLLRKEPGTITVAFLASNERGVGTKMMHQVFADAVKRGATVKVWSLDDAIGFYKKIGMTQSATDPSMFRASPKDIENILKKRETTLSEFWQSLIDAEPESGLFCQAKIKKKWRLAA
jgi:ADP-Ribosyltransferase in polyvalent proteins